MRWFIEVFSPDGMNANFRSWFCHSKEKFFFIHFWLFITSSSIVTGRIAWTGGPNYGDGKFVTGVVFWGVILSEFNLLMQQLNLLNSKFDPFLDINRQSSVKKPPSKNISSNNISHFIWCLLHFSISSKHWNKRHSNPHFALVSLLG